MELILKIKTRSEIKYSNFTISILLIFYLYSLKYQIIRINF